ncbi:tyrosine-type recombinase/integrase [Nonomuraea cavernae]|uniref:tyrosine-type recombinase/integrase n=1 Tax=Nonomuraea cavernae TaxID=2045107 RepID=UPI0033F249B5
MASTEDEAARPRSRKKAKRSFGNTRQLASGRWQARYPGPDGIVRSAPNTFDRKRDAEVWLTLKEAEIRRGEWTNPDAGTISVQEWGERWLASVSPALKPKTQSSYASLLRTLIIPQFGAMQLGQVRPIGINEWVAKLSKRGLSASRVRQAYRLLSQIMMAAVNNELIKSSPCRGVRLPRMPATEPHILTPGEVGALAAAMRKPHSLIVLLLAYGGLRIGEAFALRRRHVDLDGGLVTIAESLAEIAGRHVFDTPKSHQKREVTLPVFVINELRDHLAMLPSDPDVLLFTGKTGKPLHYNAWRRWHFDPAVSDAGLDDVTPHDLRATHATWVADRHGVMAAARRLGHSNASVTTRHYARAVEGRDKEIAEAFDGEHRKGSGLDSRRPSGTFVARPGKRRFSWAIGEPSTSKNAESGSSPTTDL